MLERAATGSTAISSGAAPAAARQRDPKAIWDEGEVPDEEDVEEDELASDPRARAEFDVLYQQGMGSEDVFMGLSDRSPATEDCDAITVRVKVRSCDGYEIGRERVLIMLVRASPQLPGATTSEVDLDVRRQHIRVTSKHQLRAACNNATLRPSIAPLTPLSLSLHSKLSTYLPHPVKEEEGKARFDAATETLAVTLPLDREEGL